MQIIVYIIILIAQYLLTKHPKPQDAQAAQIGDSELPQPDEGTPQQVLFGDGWTTSWFVLWYGNFRTVPIKSGGGSKK